MKGDISQNKAKKRILSPFEWVIERPTGQNFTARVDRLDDLDPEIGQAIQAEMTPGEQPLILLKVPSQVVEEGGKDSKRFFFNSRRILTPNWILALTSQRLLLVSITPAGAVTQLQAIPFERLLSFQQGSILLFSWIEFSSLQQGQIKRTRIYYNTSSSDLFEELSIQLRTLISGQNVLTSSSTEVDSPLLNPLSYKFRNMISMYLLLPGEQIQSLLYRPAIWQGRSFYRRELAANLAIVTSHFYFMLAEENRSNTRAKYGMIYSYIPLARVKDLSVRHEPQRLQLVLTTRLQNLEQEIKIPFPPEGENELMAFVDQFNRRHAPK